MAQRSDYILGEREMGSSPFPLKYPRLLFVFIFKRFFVEKWIIKVSAILSHEPFKSKDHYAPFLFILF